MALNQCDSCKHQGEECHTLSIILNLHAECGDYESNKNKEAV